MDYSTYVLDGQPSEPPRLAILIQYLCDLMQMLRAWYEHFEDSIRFIDRAAAVKAHDLMIEGMVAARQIARQMGFVLHTQPIDWTLKPRQPQPPSDM